MKLEAETINLPGMCLLRSGEKDVCFRIPARFHILQIFKLQQDKSPPAGHETVF